MTSTQNRPINSGTSAALLATIAKSNLNGFKVVEPENAPVQESILDKIPDEIKNELEKFSKRLSG